VVLEWKNGLGRGSEFDARPARQRRPTCLRGVRSSGLRFCPSVGLHSRRHTSLHGYTSRGFRVFVSDTSPRRADCRRRTGRIDCGQLSRLALLDQPNGRTQTPSTGILSWAKLCRNWPEPAPGRNPHRGPEPAPRLIVRTFAGGRPKREVCRCLDESSRTGLHSHATVHSAAVPATARSGVARVRDLSRASTRQGATGPP